MSEAREYSTPLLLGLGYKHDSPYDESIMRAEEEMERIHLMIELGMESYYRNINIHDAKVVSVKQSKAA